MPSEDLLELSAPTHAGGGVYVHGFPSGPKPYEEVLTFLRKGTMLLKYGRIGSPKYHHFRLSSDDSELQWESKKGQIRRVPIACIKKWQVGQDTSVFRKHPQPSALKRSFSIFYTDESKRERTLDVICSTEAEFEMWYWGVQLIRYYPPHMWPTPTTMQINISQDHNGAMLQPSTSTRMAAPQPLNLDTMSVRSSLGELERLQKPTPKAKPPGLSVTTTLQGLVGTGTRIIGNTIGGTAMGASAAGVRRSARELGDLFVWGSLVSYEDDEWMERNPRPGINRDAMHDWQQSSMPVLVQNASSIDVVRVACAPRHAALITRKGELYTWGFGKTGNLGHGQCTNVAGPRLVTRMSGKGVRAVAAGEGSTAAISADMRLYMWGTGRAGQLGNGYAFPVAEPAPVIFPGVREDTRVLAVSCGPFHTAAITENGLLWTWGNGLFGKLGHGSHESAYRPRRVEALEPCFVTCVSCGYWHTAAVAAPRTGKDSRSLMSPFGTSNTPLATPAAALPSPMLFPSGASAPTVFLGALASAGGQQFDALGRRDRLRHTASEVSSSGSDLQGAIAAAAAAGNNAAVSSSREVSGALLKDVPLPPASVAGTHNTAGSGSLQSAHHNNGAAQDGSGGGSGLNGSMTGVPVGPFGQALADAGPSLGAMTHASAGSLALNQPLLSALRSEMTSTSIASLDQLGTVRDVPDTASNSGHGGNAGMLFTWGGDFSWVEPTDPAAKRADGAPSPAPKRDHHGGCLGTGDKEGRLLPTRIRGDYDKHGAVQVACGWSMTVVRSRDGRVYQMGSTGALNAREPGCAWEGALVPTRVDGNLFGLFVEEVACGMHHVVVAASRVQANGHIPEDHRRIRILAWGRGSEGQLGTDTAGSMSAEGSLAQRIPQDYNHPQIIPSVEGKRVLHISAGGKHTMAVVEHDHRPGRMRHGPTTPTGAYGQMGAQSLGAHSVHPRVPSMHPVMASTNNFATVLRESASNITTPFSQPVAAVAAAGLQSLQNMVSNSVAPKVKPPVPTSRAGRQAAGRHGGRMVMFPDPQPYINPRIDPHRTSARRSARHHHLGVGAASGALTKSVSMSAHLGKSLDGALSVSSSGALSHQSSPPQMPGDHGSRSASPTSSSLFDAGSSEYQVAQSHGPSATSRYSSRSLTGAAGRYGSTSAPLTATLGAVPGGGLLNVSGGLDGEPEVESYYPRGRSLDMVPEQNEECVSPASPGVPSIAARLLPRHASALDDGQYSDSHDSEDLARAVRGPDASAPVPPVHKRIAMLAAAGEAPESRTSLSTITGDSSQYGPGSGSSAMSPSAGGTGSADMHDDATTQARSPLAGGPFAAATEDAHHSVRQHLAQSSAHSTAGQESTSSTGLPLSTRTREVSISAWAQTSLMSAASASALSSGGGSVAVSASRQPSAALHRPEASFRAFTTSYAVGSLMPEGASTPTVDAAAAIAGGTSSAPVVTSSAGTTVHHRTSSTNVPGGLVAGAAVAGRRSSARGSRGHSRHTSYESLDVGSGRDVDLPPGVKRHSSVSSTAFELPQPPFMASGGGSGAQTPPRLSAGLATPIASDSAASALLHQNELLQRQVEALQHQVTLLTKAAGLGVAAAAAGGAAAAAGAAVGGLVGYPANAPSPNKLSPGPVSPHGPMLATAAGTTTVTPTEPTSATSSNSMFGIAQTQLLPPPPLQVHQAIATSTSLPPSHAAFSAIPHPTQVVLQPAQPHGTHSGVPPPSPAGRASAGPAMILHAPGGMVGPQGLPPPAGPPARHRRSTSVDVSSLIATRDGIGPARDYLAPAPSYTGPHHIHTLSHAHSLMQHSAPVAERDITALGHATAPPALEALRKAHPGMSIAQAALAEVEHEGEDETDEELEREEEEDEEEELGVVPDHDADVEGGGETTEGGEMDEYSARNSRTSRSRSAPAAEALLAAANAGAMPLPPPGLLAGPHVPAALQPQVSMRRQQQYVQQQQQQAALRSPSSRHHAPFEADRPMGVSVPVLQAHPIPLDGYTAGSPDTSSFAQRTDASEASSLSGHYPAEQGTADAGLRSRAPAGRGHDAHGGLRGSGGAGAHSMGADDGGASVPSDAAMFQYAPGVFVTLRPPAQPGGRMELCKLRFSRRHFSQQEAQQWWATHKAAIHDKYHVTASVGGSGGGGAGGSSSVPVAATSRGAGAYPPSPSGGPGGQSPPQPSTSGGPTHTRGMSIDTQGTSGSGVMVVHSNSGMYFSLANSANSPGALGYSLGAPVAAGGGGSGGSAVGSHRSSAVMRTGGDPYAPWADQTYTVISEQEPNALHLVGLHPPALPQAHGVHVAPGVPPRHSRSRSGSRTASGGASTGGVPGAWVPSGGSGGSGVGAGAAAAHVQLQQVHHRHTRSRSGGAQSTLSTRS